MAETVKDVSEAVTTLIQGLQLRDPRLYEALSLINKNLYAINVQLNPLIEDSIVSVVEVEILDPPIGFAHILTQEVVRFTWNDVIGATLYEVRRGNNPDPTNWDTASFQFRTTNLTADIDPLLTGIYVYLIKSINSSGVYSLETTQTTVTIPVMEGIFITAQVIDNNILLYWTPTLFTFRISYYEISKNGSILGQFNGTFFTYFETVSGTYLYEIVAVDIAGNRSETSTTFAEVKQPPDFTLESFVVSTLNGTLTNMEYRVDEPCIVGPWIPISWRDHFDDNSWSTIRDQINAGYPVYLQPGTGVGTYEERIDYSSVFNSIVVTVLYNYRLLSAGNDVVVTIEMKSSLDDITYSAYAAGAVQYFATFRYLKIKLTFTRANAHSLIKIYNLQVRLDVKREQDGGFYACLAADAGGTVISFNKSFKDIDTVTATAMGTANRTVIIDFTDVANPTSFKALVFDAAGVRVNSDIRWIARGIL